MELTIDKNLGGSVWTAHGAIPLIPGEEVPVELLVKFDEEQQTAELYLDQERPTLIQGRRVLKYTKAKSKDVPKPEVGQKISFSNFFVNIKK